MLSELAYRFFQARPRRYPPGDSDLPDAVADVGDGEAAHLDLMRFEHLLQPFHPVARPGNGEAHVAAVGPIQASFKNLEGIQGDQNDESAQKRNPRASPAEARGQADFRGCLAVFRPEEVAFPAAQISILQALASELVVAFQMAKTRQALAWRLWQNAGPNA